MDSTSHQKKSVFLVLQSGNKLSVHFTTSSDNDVYFMTNPEVFSGYIASLFERPNRDITTIHIFKSFQELLPQLRFLRQFNQQRDMYQRIYTETYKKVLSELQGLEIHLSITLSQGQNDIPLACKPIFVIDTNVFDSDDLATKNVQIQQYLRVIAYKLGGLVMAMSAEDFLKDPIGQLPSSTPMPVFNHDNKVKLNIPTAWDSWAKIVLVAKLAVKSRDEGILDSNEKVEEFDKGLLEYFANDKFPDVLKEI